VKLRRDESNANDQRLNQQLYRIREETCTTHSRQAVSGLVPFLRIVSREAT
jgi:hypothetical protein